MDAVTLKTSRTVPRLFRGTGGNQGVAELLGASGSASSGVSGS